MMPDAADPEWDKIKNDSRCYYVVKYEWRDEDGSTYITERVFDIFDDASNFVKTWGCDTGPMIEKRMYGNPYCVVKKAEFTKEEYDEVKRRLKENTDFIQLLKHVNDLLIDERCKE